MAVLNFTKNDNDWYEATASVSSDFNLHVERVKSGIIEIWVSTIEDGKKAKAYEKFVTGNVFDHDFDSRVYPKYIKVLSSAMVTSATITEVS